MKPMRNKIGIRKKMKRRLQSKAQDQVARASTGSSKNVRTFKDNSQLKKGLKWRERWHLKDEGERDNIKDLIYSFEGRYLMNINKLGWEICMQQQKKVRWFLNCKLSRNREIVLNWKTSRILKEELLCYAWQLGTSDMSLPKCHPWAQPKFYNLNLEHLWAKN